MADENKSVATPEQIAEFDALIASFTGEQQAAVTATWRAAQKIGYRTGSRRVFAVLTAAA